MPKHGAGWLPEGVYKFETPEAALQFLFGPPQQDAHMRAWRYEQLRLQNIAIEAARPAVYKRWEEERRAFREYAEREREKYEAELPAHEASLKEATRQLVEASRRADASAKERGL